MKPRTTIRKTAAIGASAALILALTACGGGATPTPGASGGGGAANVNEGSNFVVLTANENPALRTQLDNLAKGVCSAANTALPLQHETVAQADVVTKMTQLASQGALPNHFIAGTAQVRPNGDLGKANVLLDYEKALTEAGAWNNVSPAAATTVKNVYGGMVSLPYQYNVEGIWYNKKLFAANNITEPKTYDELLTAMDKLKAAGVTPMTQGGKQGWPLTRLIGIQIYRTVGPNALADVRDGKAKMTDPDYVKGAQALADMAAKGYLGEGVSTRESDAATAQFLTGKAAMTYNGSWLLSNVNDPKQNTIGVDAVGFMPFPSVTGGKGSAEQWPANAGASMSFRAKDYGPKNAAWLKCIAENFGEEALKTSGQISGLKVNREVTNVAPATKMVQEKVASAKESVLWFEALMDQKSNALASTNVSLLVTGQMSAADYMAKLQQSIEANK